MSERRPGFVLGFRLRWALFSALGAAVVLGAAAFIMLSGDSQPERDSSVETPTTTSSPVRR